MEALMLIFPEFSKHLVLAVYRFRISISKDAVKHGLADEVLK